MSVNTLWRHGPRRQIQHLELTECLGAFLSCATGDEYAHNGRSRLADARLAGSDGREKLGRVAFQRAYGKEDGGLQVGCQLCVEGEFLRVCDRRLVRADDHDRFRLVIIDEIVEAGDDIGPGLITVLPDLFGADPDACRLRCLHARLPDQR